MYTVLGNVIKNPLTIIVLLCLTLLLIFSIGNVFENVRTSLGFETKENVKDKLNNTENQLDKLVEINTKNEADKKIEDSLNKVVEDKLIKDAKDYSDIFKEESDILSNAKEVKTIQVAPVVTPVSNTVKYTGTREQDKLTDSQVNILNNLVIRANKMEGSK